MLSVSKLAGCATALRFLHHLKRQSPATSPSGSISIGRRAKPRSTRYPWRAKDVSYQADEAREWWRDDYPLPDLNGCVHIDVAATPLTNTFPIRRFASLGIAEHRTTPVAWVEVPTLHVTRVEQTYRRLAPDRWEYSDPTHGAFELSIDDDGFVSDYEGFASRVTQ